MTAQEMIIQAQRGQDALEAQAAKEFPGTPFDRVCEFSRFYASMAHFNRKTIEAASRRIAAKA